MRIPLDTQIPHDSGSKLLFGHRPGFMSIKGDPSPAQRLHHPPWSQPPEMGIAADQV